MKPWKIVSIIAVVVVLGIGVLLALGVMGTKKKPQQAKQQQTTQNILRIHTSTRMPNAQASCVAVL